MFEPAPEEIQFLHFDQESRNTQTQTQIVFTWRLPRDLRSFDYHVPRASSRSADRQHVDHTQTLGSNDMHRLRTAATSSDQSSKHFAGNGVGNNAGSMSSGNMRPKGAVGISFDSTDTTQTQTQTQNQTQTQYTDSNSKGMMDSFGTGMNSASQFGRSFVRRKSSAVEGLRQDDFRLACMCVYVCVWMCLMVVIL